MKNRLEQVRTGLIFGSTVAELPDAQIEPSFGGPILERSNLTGDWWGRRSDLRDKGVTPGYLQHTVLSRRGHRSDCSNRFSMADETTTS